MRQEKDSGCENKNMSKLRIYELAKELGVDNKVIISKATELGFHGKSSHSSSLDADEADQIRRAIIRQSFAVRDSEKVTVRVDKVTGATEAIVEKRKGNVIRRRKQDSGSSAEGSAAGGREDETHKLGAEVSEETEHEAQQQPVAESHHAESAVEAPAVEMQTEEVAPVAESVEASETVQETMGEASEVSQIQESEVVSEVSQPAVEETPLAEEEPSQPAEAQAAASVEVAAAVQKKTIGPRVLGRIELPQKKATATSAARAETRKAGPYAAVVAAVPEIEEEEEDKKSRKGAFKKKGLKREISRIDLLDYEGGETRRAGRVGGKSKRKEAEEEKKAAQPEVKVKAGKRVIKMADTITVGEMAKQMSVKSGEVIAKLMQFGVLATINQVLDSDIAGVVAEEFEYQIESTSFDEAAALEDKAAEDPALAKPRPPVVTVMGHVDHGKTSLLDAIRKASVAAREHGGITQHIGAYSVKMEDGRSISFIDTPGHAAFTSMRARGAKVTDIVILVVAADDGVMPQTIEAINHAKAAGVPIVVAVNKIDKHEANPDRVRQQLIEHGLQPEDWGGDTIFCNVSAIKGTGLKEMLESVLLVAEMKELRANPDTRARGAVVEVKQDRGRGTVATVLVQSGTLRVGDVFVAGAEVGRVRSMSDCLGEKVEAAGPSMPVEITGIAGIPLAGDDFFVLESEAKAREVAADRAQKLLIREQRASAMGPLSLESFAKRANDMAAMELNVIIKADVQGSVEAVRDSVEKLSTGKVRVKVIHAAVGGINESDVQLAIASQALILGFGVRSEVRAAAEAEAAGIEMRFYRIIYELLDDVRKAMAGKLAPIKQEVSLGRVEVRDTFSVPKVGTVAGCYVVDGSVKRGAFIRLVRDSRVIHEGRMSSLKRFKDDVREVQSGYECGIGIDNYNDVKAGDIIEVFEYKEIAASLD